MSTAVHNSTQRTNPGPETLIAERVHLLANGFTPVLCDGKRALEDDWTEKHTPTAREIEERSRAHPRWTNTGLLARNAPGLDIDILDEGAAQAVEDMTRQRFGARGRILVRIGLPPKRLIPFRCDDPFKKLAVPFANGGKLEFLGDGQQFVALGEHPDTRRPYEWENGKSPLGVKRDELPASARMRRGRTSPTRSSCSAIISTIKS